MANDELFQNTNFYDLSLFWTKLFLWGWPCKLLFRHIYFNSFPSLTFFSRYLFITIFLRFKFHPYFESRFFFHKSIVIYYSAAIFDYFCPKSKIILIVMYIFFVKVHQEAILYGKLYYWPYIFGWYVVKNTFQCVWTVVKFTIQEFLVGMLHYLYSHLLNYFFMAKSNWVLF